MFNLEDKSIWWLLNINIFFMQNAYASAIIFLTLSFSHITDRIWYKGRPCTDYTACNYTSYNMFLLAEYSFFLKVSVHQLFLSFIFQISYVKIVFTLKNTLHNRVKMNCTMHGLQTPNEGKNQGNLKIWLKCMLIVK